MATVLLFVIFASFIGLGLPDSIFGASWPAIYTELNISYSYANFVTFLTCIGSAIASIFSVKIIKKFGTGLTTVISNLLCTLAILGISFSNNVVFIILLSLPLGLGAGAIDSGLNNYVALHYKASHMSFLHCFYGLGVSASPFLMFLALSGLGSWRAGYRLVFGILLAISIVTIIALPLWGRVASKNINKTQEQTEPVKEEKEINFGFVDAIKMPSVRVSWAIFLFSVGLEFVIGGWGSTYFFNIKNLTKDFSAFVMTFYYLGITLGRFVSGILSKKLLPMSIIKLGQCVVIVGIILLFLPFSTVLSVIGLVLIGVGNGPLFPNLTYLTPIHYGVKKSQAVISVQMFASTFGAAVLPVLFGVVAHFSLAIFPFAVLVFGALMIIFTFLYNKKYLPKIIEK